ncbi:hypothetical protein [Rhodococcus sp. CX]|nr:hypothetical protein [Rhodococcus sp. CX]
MLFGSSGLTPVEWAKVLGVGLTVFFVAEAEKWAIRRIHAGREGL